MKHMCSSQMKILVFFFFSLSLHFFFSNLGRLEFGSIILIHLIASSEALWKSLELVEILSDSS